MIDCLVAHVSLVSVDSQGQRTGHPQTFILTTIQTAMLTTLQTTILTTMQTTMLTAILTTNPNYSSGQLYGPGDASP